MNETERDRILRMVAEGTLRPHEAAHLLAALADEPAGKDSQNGNAKKKDGKKDAAGKSSTPPVEVQMERADGSLYTVKVPPALVPMLWEITKASVRELARSAAQDTWLGLKAIVRRKTSQVTSDVRERFAASKAVSKPVQPAISPVERHAVAARRQILELVQTGTITADDAGRLIKQIDAHAAYQTKMSAAVPNG